MPPPCPSLPLTLALGSNLGDRRAHLAAARRLVAARIGPLLAASRVVETAAWGLNGQPAYLNQVLAVPWSPPADPARLTAGLHELLDLTQGIENELGRVRTQRWGPRTCDVDLVFAGLLRHEDERLSLPHPWWARRDFVGGLIRSDLPNIGAHPWWLRTSSVEG